MNRQQLEYAVAFAAFETTKTLLEAAEAETNETPKEKKEAKFMRFRNKIEAYSNNMLFDWSADYSRFSIAESPVEAKKKTCVQFFSTSEGMFTSECVDYMKTFDPVLMTDEDGNHVAVTLYAETVNPTAHYSCILEHAASSDAPETMKLYQSDVFGLPRGDTWEDENGNIYRLDSWEYDDEYATWDKLKAEINRQAQHIGLDTSRFDWGV